MKKHYTFFFALFVFVSFTNAQVQNATFTFDPTAFNEDEQITITVSGVDPTIWNAGELDNIYLWAWYFDTNGNEAGDSATNGTWTSSDESQKLTNNGDGTYSITLTPTTFFNDTNIGQMGMLVKAKDGTGDKKSQDFLYFVGKVNLSIITPSENPVVIQSGDDISLSAVMESAGSAQVGDFEVFYNNTSIETGQGYPVYTTTITNVTQSGTLKVVGSPFTSSDSGEDSVEVIVAPSVTTQVLPAGMENGINYDPADVTKATLVLDAPNKDFIYVAGSFNNWNPDTSYLMKKNTTGTKFWLEISGLTLSQIETYQYWVYDTNPVTNSPALVKTADPFSTLVLSPFDDPWIPTTTYPNLPAYPSGQEREVTVLQTGQTPYNWQVTNFAKPKKEDLIVYEVLIRDFDADRNFEDLIDRIDYFKNLNINAIELMPIMEFEGNESWGYNTSFHMALDKFYGTEDKFREFVDTCHQNGIAVILDIALNHAFGRNPMNRMWMNDPDGNGWGEPSSENPYFNQFATHSYSVGSDFNHQQPTTQYYAERVIKHWIEEFNIDGFRWDLTKGFTQNCTGSDSCTNSYQQDRVDILKQYADYSWSLDPGHYVIFEHLGGDTEEQEWANYRLGEGKGIMMWSEMFDSYKNLANGNASNFDRMGNTAHGFTGKRTLGYPESHDKDRIMYEMTEFGNSGGGYDIKDLNTALERMSALGAVTIPIPGPKMIWHFADLGMDNSIWLCDDGVTVNSDYDGNNDGDCKLSTKPQPQWVENWLGDTNRSQIYNDWARLNSLKINEDVFEGSYSIDSGDLTPRIFIWDDAIPTTQLKNVVILANFDVTAQNVTPDFPYIGTWHDLMDETGSTSINVTSTTNPINIQPGQFKIYGNQSSTLSIDDFETLSGFAIYPNPVNSTFAINSNVSSLNVYDITGKLITEYKGSFTKGELFDVSNLNQGIYIIELENDNNQKTTTKLIKL